MQSELNADVALSQKRDFSQPIVDSPTAASDLQQTLDRVFWKNDFALRTLIRGDVLKAVLDKSKAFDAADNNSLSLEQERDRGLIYLGVIFDPVTSQYYVHGDALDPARMYSVTASDYIALGDTGYSDLVTPAVGQSIRLSTYSSLSYTSAIVCRHVSASVAGLHGANCRDDPQTADGTENDLAARFAGVPVSQVNAPNTNTTLIDFSSRMQRDSRTNSAFAQLDRLQSSAHAPG